MFPTYSWWGVSLDFPLYRKRGRRGYFTMSAVKISVVDEIMDEMEVSDLIQVGDFRKATIWHMDVPNEGIYSFILSEISQEALTLPQRVALKKAARCEARTKMYRLEGPVRGKLMPLSVKAFTGYPVLDEIFAENMDQAEARLIARMASTIEIVGAGVMIAASPRESYETRENLTISVEDVDAAIASAEQEGDRDTVRALRRAIRLGEQRISAISRGKEKKVEEGQVALF